jgi:hypothetical protein
MFSTPQISAKVLEMYQHTMGQLNKSHIDYILLESTIKSIYKGEAIQSEHKWLADLISSFTVLTTTILNQDYDSL